MMPYVLAGSAGGKLRAGRLLDYGTTRRDNNQMLVSIGQAMGATDLTSFGDPSGATGPLPTSPDSLGRAHGRERHASVAPPCVRRRPTKEDGMANVSGSFSRF